MSYDIHKHKHNFAVWAAGRAASRGTKNLNTANVEQLIKAVGLDGIKTPDHLPENFCDAHKKWREDMIKHAKTLRIKLSHGRAAKVINIYLKGILVCGGHENHAKIENIHPPIDRLLLNALEKEFNHIDVYKGAENKNWTKFSSKDYEAVIKNIKKISNGEPLWKIEKYWPVHKNAQ